MLFTYEIKAVFKYLLNQIPLSLDDSNEKFSHVKLTFKQEINSALFAEHFGALSKIYYAISDNTLIIQKENFDIFEKIIKKHYLTLEMQLNHKKYETLLSHLLKNSINEIYQSEISAPVVIQFDDSINTNLFNNIILLNQDEFTICDKELRIEPEGIDDFNKQINVLYVELTQSLLSKEQKQTFSVRMY